MRRFARAALVAGLAIALPGTALAQDGGGYPGPDAAVTHRAAVRALPGKRLPIVGKTVAIVGASRGIDAVLEELDAKVTEREITIALSADVLFDFDAAEVKPAAAPELDKVATVLTSHPDAPVTIEGHTDSRGSDAYNQTLSERRADSVKAWLVSRANVDGSRIRTRGWGESKPVAPNATPAGADDPEGRQRNRRVEITLTTAGAR